MISLKTISKSWDKFFFSTGPTDGLAIFRMVWMGIIFFYWMIDFRMIDEFYGPYAVVTQEVSRSQFPDLIVNLFNLVNPTVAVAYGLFIIYGLAIISSCLGLFTRKSLIIALILMTSFHQRNMWLLSSSELLMRSITFLLIFSPCGHSLSIDSWLGKYFPQFARPKVWSLWCLRLIQIQLSIVYLWTVWHKLKGEAWVNGDALYYATRLENLASFGIPFVFNSILIMKFLTWGTLLLEFSLGSLIWIENFRKPLIIMGIVFHLAIQYVMSIPFFELFMIALLINFFTPQELSHFAHKVINHLRNKFHTKLLKLKLSIIRG